MLAAFAASSFAQTADPLIAEEGERALERALARQSVLVLPRGTYEIEPSLEYSYRGSEALEIVSIAGVAQVARQIAKRDRLEARLSLRAGLPGAAHIEARIPYVMVRDDRATTGVPASTTTIDGWGDVEISVTKELVAERPSRTGWLASLMWKAPSGDFRFGEISTGSGFHAWQGGLAFVRRQDPLVFFGTGSYTYIRERAHEGLGIDPGDSLGAKFGTILAASPQTSIRGAFELTRSERLEVNGAKLAGSDTVVASLQLGLGTLLSRSSLLDIQLSIGVTADAPDFAVTAAVPIRF
jgi:hypothetical protein